MSNDILTLPMGVISLDAQLQAHDTAAIDADFRPGPLGASGSLEEVRP